MKTKKTRNLSHKQKLDKVIKTAEG